MSSDFGTKPVYLVQTIDETINLIVRIFAKTRLNLEIMVDNDWLCHLANSSSFITFIKNLKINNTIVKIVTNVIESNVSYSKKLMKLADVKHSDKLQGCTIKNEHTFCFSHYSENEPIVLRNELELLDKLVQFFYIENKNFNNQQTLLFENLWNNSISAREKIIEIEKHVKEIILKHEAKSNVDVNSSQVLFRIIESCVDQISILIPTTHLFWSIYDSKLLHSISTMLVKEVTAKILIHVEEGQNTLKDEIRYKLKDLAQDLIISTNFFSKKIPHSYVSIIVDGVVLAEVRYNYEKQMLPQDGIHSLISFFIQDARVSSSSSMFDILWIQSDFERQQKIKQTYFDIFKGLKLKSENYNRNWNFERKKSNSSNQNNSQDKETN
jgi:hypothetical protein